MSLRLIEIVLPGGYRNELLQSLEKEKILDIWQEEIEESRLHLKILVSTEYSEEVLDFLEKSFGLNNLGELLPHEVGGLAAGAFVPVGILWMVIAFFERGQQLRRETEVLRVHLKKLIYPSDAAESRMKEVTAALRAQTKELLAASEEAARRGQQVSDLVRERTPPLVSNSFMTV